MAIIQNNSLLPISSPVFPPKLTVLGSLVNGYDINDLIREKYPEMTGLLTDLTKCEARWRHDGLWGDNYNSYGVFQFQEDTFYSYCSSGWDWQDMEDQLDCSVIMIKLGLGPKTVGWYNCYKIMDLCEYDPYCN